MDSGSTRDPGERSVAGPVLGALGLIFVVAQTVNAYTGDITPAVDENPDPNIFETTLIADEAMIDLTGSGPLAEVFAFNGMVPGPEIRVKVGDRVIVHVQNQLDEPMSIHWHGIELNNLSDGTTVTQNPILPNGAFDYDFIVTRPGPFWYHPHVMPTDQVFRGLYGPLIVTSNAEAILEGEGVLPTTARTLVLSDTTMCIDVGIGDPLEAQCLGRANGFIPKVQPDFDCRNDGPQSCNVAEGRTILSNGRVLQPTDGLDVTAGAGVRFQVINSAIQRYFRLVPPPGHMLFRVGGEGGLLDNVRLEGGDPGSIDDKFDLGEILLAPADRADIVLVPDPGLNIGDEITIETESYDRGNTASTAVGPVVRLRITGTGGSFSIAEGDPLLTHLMVNTPLEDMNAISPLDLDLLLDPSVVPNIGPGPTPGSSSHLIQFQAPVLDGGSMGPAIDGVRGRFDASTVADYKDVPHVGSSRFAFTGSELELMVTNTTGSHHPFHMHGFSFQPIRLDDGVGNVFDYDYREFVDNVDIQNGHTLAFRVRLKDRPMDGAGLDPTGGAAGRWLFHCHQFHHAGLGMISELVVLPRSSVPGLQALYTFQEGSGPTVFDVSGVAPAMNLTIEDEDRVTWLQGGGLSIDAPTIVETFAPADKILQASISTNEVSVEAWIKPANVTQNGPARIVALTGNPVDPSNFMVGQGLWGNQPSDLITARCPLNDHLSATNTPPGSLTSELTHVVFTRQFSTNTNRVYINGNLVASSERIGDFSDWDPTYHLNVANDQTRDRPWLGELYRIAIYDRELPEEEVERNFNAGPDSGPGSPGIVLEKTPDLQFVPSGADVDFTLTVTNIGAEDLSGIMITDQCTGGLNLQPGGNGNGDTILQVGESWEYTCTVSNVTAPFTNTATVDAEDPFGVMVSDSDTAQVLIQSERVTRGLQVLYTFDEGQGTLVNDVSGVGAPLNLTIADEQDVSWPPGGGLSINQSTVVSSQVEAEKIITACQASNEISIEAWMDPANLNQDGPARVVTNGASATTPSNFMLGQGRWGSQPRDIVDVRLRTTAQQSSTTSDPGSLTAGLRHVVYTRAAGGAVGIYIDGGLAKTGNVTGDFSNWIWSHPLVLANEATGDRPWLGELELVAIYCAALTQGEVSLNFDAGPDVGGAVSFDISIDKTPDAQAVISGTDASFNLIVQNLGTTDLSNVIVTDPECDPPVTFIGVDDGDMILQPDETWTYTCSTSNVIADFTNTASVTADEPGGDTVNDMDSADVRLLVPNITIDKTPDQQTLVSGSDAIFAVVVQNTGELDLSNVNVADTDCSPPILTSGDDNNDSILQTTETWTYSCSVNNVTADFTNTASVLADEPGGGTVGDVDSADVSIAVPGVMIDKTPNTQSVSSGTDATFTLLIQNTGELDLSNVQVTDPDCAPPIIFVDGDDNGDSLLQPDETWTYTCTVSNVTADFTNTANVTADEPGGGNLQDSDSADVTVVVGGRVQTDLKLLYTFEDGTGASKVSDVSNVLPALDLTIQNTAAVTWLPGGGLSVDSPTVLLSAGAADKIIAGSQATNEITLEAWIRPANVVQQGPARIAANSLDPFSTANFMLGEGRWGSQPADVIDVRLATTAQQSSTMSPAGSLTANLHHVVYTRAAEGTVTIYIDNVPVITNNVGGDFSNWNSTFALALANAPTGDRPWLGELHLFAIYCRALTADEVGENFDVGTGFAAPPQAVDDPDYLTLSDVALSVSAGPGDLLDNDTPGSPAAALISFGGGSLGGSVTDHVAGTSALFGPGLSGSLTVNADGSFDFTSAAGFNGAFTFEYRIGNPSGTSDALATIQVQDLPTAVDDDVMVFEDDPATAIDVLGNDTDLGAATIASVTQPANGTAVNAVTGMTYQPDPGFCNDGAPTDDFTDTLTPGGSTATVAMTVECVDTVVLGAARDNTIYSEADVSNGAGVHMFAGQAGPRDPPHPTSGAGGLRRALIGFDISGNVPAGSVIRKVVMTVHSSTHAHGEGPQAVALHRLLTDWGEGTTDAPMSEGHGVAANPGDVTWQHTFFPDSFWAAPGADFSPVVGSVAVIPEEGQDGEGGQGDERPHDWGSTPEMVADVQAWLANPAENYGWILIGNEVDPNSSKRFETRHTLDPALRPSLTIKYNPPE